MTPPRNAAVDADATPVGLTAGRLLRTAEDPAPRRQPRVVLMRPGFMSRIGAGALSLALLLVGACSDQGVARTAGPASSTSPSTTPTATTSLPDVPSEGVILDVAGVATF